MPASIPVGNGIVIMPVADKFVVYRAADRRDATMPRNVRDVAKIPPPLFQPFDTLDLAQEYAVITLKEERR